jgi:gas vesicle protein
MIEFLASQITGIILGAIAGAVIMFFVAQKNPEWVQSTYQKQRAASMQGTEKVAELEKKLADMEIDKTIAAKVAEAIAKLKG